MEKKIKSNVSMIKHTASDVFFVLWLALLFREGTNFIRFS